MGTESLVTSCPSKLNVTRFPSCEAPKTSVLSGFQAQWVHPMGPWTWEEARKSTVTDVKQVPLASEQVSNL